MTWLVRIGAVVVGLPAVAAALLALAHLRPSVGRNVVTVDIGRPARQVFTYFSELDRVKQWASGIVAFDPPSGGIHVGDQYRVTMEVDGQRTIMHEQVVAFEPDRVLALRLRDAATPPMFTEEAEFRLDGSADGGTRLTATAQTRYHGLPWLLEPLITHVAQRKLEGDLARLKQVCESRGPLAAVTL
jgi:uncharacterized protein YndB with AHSA1/START domain